MKPKFSLAQMRDVWIDAYASGDIDQLDFVECDHFFVKRGEKMLSKRQQLGHIRSRVAAGTWDRPHVRDESIDVTEHAAWATVSGVGSMMKNAKACSRFSFVELWLVSGGRWQVAALCYEDLSRAGQVLPPP
ncbi:DUF4440 domain-containing protein [Cupriavidus sp. 30B13]|uniref:DUF4440 domain-containing protein n=1 Tax=Cupriavidus sp. 30B13 TaxID=3384241 RepID=UPI003B8F3162